jgi:hypothetical protein
VKILPDSLNLWFWLLVFVPFFILDAVCTVLFVTLIIHVFRVKAKVNMHRGARTTRASIDRTSLASDSSSGKWFSDTFLMLRSQLKKQDKMMRFATLIHTARTLYIVEHRFLLLFCMGELYCASITLYAYKIHYTTYSTGMVDWIECLVYTSAYEVSSDSVYNQCGRVSPLRVPVWMVMSLEVYFGAVGVIPALVFGIKRKDDRKQWLKLRLYSWASRLLHISTENTREHRLVEIGRSTIGLAGTQDEGTPTSAQEILTALELADAHVLKLTSNRSS